MKKQNTTLERACPTCKSEEEQIKIGYTRSGTQRFKCKVCGKTYTLEPKRHAYDEETRTLAIKAYYSGVSGRGVGKMFGMSKANVYNWIKKNESNS